MSVSLVITESNPPQDLHLQFHTQFGVENTKEIRSIIIYMKNPIKIQSEEKKESFQEVQKKSLFEKNKENYSICNFMPLEPWQTTKQNGDRKEHKQKHTHSHTHLCEGHTHDGETLN